ncbi:MAG: Hpt domain-containing protein [Deltaproteobacteria bacterium]|nr:Hpt domain-containing protein [Deltaproteobacteria bacterium]
MRKNQWLTGNRCTATARLAHKLRGSAANIGAKLLAQTCLRVEESAKNSSHCDELLGTLDSQFEFTKGQLLTDWAIRSET